MKTSEEFSWDLLSVPMLDTHMSDENYEEFLEDYYEVQCSAPIEINRTDENRWRLFLKHTMRSNAWHSQRWIKFIKTLRGFSWNLLWRPMLDILKGSEILGRITWSLLQGPMFDTHKGNKIFWVIPWSPLWRLMRLNTHRNGLKKTFKGSIERDQVHDYILRSITKANKSKKSS